MATLTRSLVSAAVLTGTAAVAVVTPVTVPHAQPPSTLALDSAKVQLATFSDLLSITPNDYSNILFGGYGEALSPNQDPNFDWAAAFISPFTRCDLNCLVNGPSGIAYVVLDALINGNGTGYANVTQDPTKPYQPDEGLPDYNPYVKGHATWNISAVNYYFEGGAGPGTAYLFAQPFGDPQSPLYNPDVATVIVQAFNGLANVTNFYIAALDAISKLAKNVPAVGPYVYGAIQAYLGPNTSDNKFGDWGYFAGLSGVLRYVSDVITSGGNPSPPYGSTSTSGTGTAGTTSLAAAALSASTAGVRNAAKVVTAVEPTPKAADTGSAAGTGSTADTGSAAGTGSTAGTGSISATDGAVESRPADTTVRDKARTDTAETEKTAVQSTAADDVKPVETPAASRRAARSGVSTAVKPSRHPVRDAVEKIGKQLSVAGGAGKSAKSGASESSSVDTPK